MTNFEGTSVYNIIYIYSLADTGRQGQLNVGVASVDFNGHPQELKLELRFSEPCSKRGYSQEQHWRQCCRVGICGTCRDEMRKQVLCLWENRAA